MLARDKHSSLLRKYINYGRNKFYSTGSEPSDPPPLTTPSTQRSGRRTSTTTPTTSSTRRCRPCKLRAAGRRALRLRLRGGELHGALKSGGARHRRGPRVVRGGRTLRRGRLYDARRFAGSLCCTIPSGRAWASGVGPWARSGDLLSGRCSRAGRLRVCACSFPRR